MRLWKNLGAILFLKLAATMLVILIQLVLEKSFNRMGFRYWTLSQYLNSLTLVVPYGLRHTKTLISREMAWLSLVCFISVISLSETNECWLNRFLIYNGSDPWKFRRSVPHGMKSPARNHLLRSLTTSRYRHVDGEWVLQSLRSRCGHNNITEGPRDNGSLLRWRENLR